MNGPHFASDANQWAASGSNFDQRYADPEDLYSQPRQPEPPAPSQLRHTQKTPKKSLLASPVVKNIAGLMILSGTGIVKGCPALITALITAGAASSWCMGIGIVIGSIGIALLIYSIYVSIDESPATEKSACQITYQIVEGAKMGLVGIPYVMLNSFLTCCQHCCCHTDTALYDDFSVPTTYPPQRPVKPVQTVADSTIRDSEIAEALVNREKFISIVKEHESIAQRERIQRNWNLILDTIPVRVVQPPLPEPPPLLSSQLHPAPLPDEPGSPTENEVSAPETESEKGASAANLTAAKASSSLTDIHIA